MNGWVVVIGIALVVVVVRVALRKYEKENEQDERWRKEAEENDKWFYNWHNQSASEEIKQQELVIKAKEQKAVWRAKQVDEERLNFDNVASICKKVIKNSVPERTHYSVVDEIYKELEPILFSGTELREEYYTKLSVVTNADFNRVLENLISELLESKHLLSMVYLDIDYIKTIYEKYAMDYATQRFRREYRKIHTKQGNETEAFRDTVNDYCRAFRLTLFDDYDIIRDVYREKFSVLSWQEFEFALEDELQNIIDGKPLYTNKVQTVVGGTVQRERTVTHSQRQRILRRDNFTCQLCGARGPGARPVGGTSELRVDHKLPFSKGGSDDDDNLWTLCFECNSGKSDNYDDSGM